MVSDRRDGTEGAAAGSWPRPAGAVEPPPQRRLPPARPRRAAEPRPAGAEAARTPPGEAVPGGSTSPAGTGCHLRRAWLQG